MYRRLQESSCASTSDVVIIYNVAQAKPLLSVAMSGVLVTRRRIPGAFIERIWIKRSTPFTLRSGKKSYAQQMDDSHGHEVWFFVHYGLDWGLKSVYSGICREIIRQLKHTSEQLTFADVFKDTVARNGFGSLCDKVLPAMRNVHPEDTVQLFPLRDDRTQSGRRR
jgi:hypothetical protein